MSLNEAVFSIHSDTADISSTVDCGNCSRCGCAIYWIRVVYKLIGSKGNALSAITFEEECSVRKWVSRLWLEQRSLLTT